MSASRILLFVLLAGGLQVQPAVAQSPPAESLPERSLKQIIERQKTLLADAAKAGNNFDKESLRAQLQSLADEYELLLQGSPDFAAAWADYGYLLEKLEMPREAAGVLLKADKLDPHIPLVKNELGNILAEDGKPLEAVNYYVAAIQLDPKEPLYHYQLGLLLYEARDDFISKGVYTRADLERRMHDAFRRAAELAPERLEFTYRYAESFYDLTVSPDWEGAFQAWAALADKASSPTERQTMLLHEANVRLKQHRAPEARAILAEVTEPTLQIQKQKLVAELAENAKK
jgi:tetratricopeptide (TPR) repeat protein